MTHFRHMTETSHKGCSSGGERHPISADERPWPSAPLLWKHATNWASRSSPERRATDPVNSSIRGRLLRVTGRRSNNDPRQAAVDTVVPVAGAKRNRWLPADANGMPAQVGFEACIDSTRVETSMMTSLPSCHGRANSCARCRSRWCHRAVRRGSSGALAQAEPQQRPSSNANAGRRASAPEDQCPSRTKRASPAPDHGAGGHQPGFVKSRLPPSTSPVATFK